MKIQLIVRGICCILPGIPGKTDNLQVTSIVGRFLEHPRVFVFGRGADAKVYIGSADMMTRNTENRVEVACPIYDETIRRRLIHDLKVMLSDNVKAREMTSDGTYRKKEAGEKAVNAQETFMKEAINARRPSPHIRKKEKNSLLNRIFGLFGRKEK